MGTINFYVFVENEYIYIKLSNVYYLHKLDINLILFKIFKEKMCEFWAINDLLKIKNKKKDII